MDKSQLQLLEKAPVKQAVLKLAIPTMIGMAMVLIYNMTDMFFIGRTGDPMLVAAISLVSPVMMIIQAVGNIFANGTASYISRKLGEKEYDEARRANSTAFWSLLLTGAFFSILFIALKEPLLQIIGTSEATIGPAREYMVIISLFMIAAIFQVGLAGLARSEGATDKAMNGMIIGIGLNIVLDPIFILVLDMGTAGAAWATGIGNLFGTAYFILHFVSKKTLLSIKPADFKPSKKIYGETFKIGVPAALSTLIMSISMILVNIIAATYGDYVVAGNGIQMRVASMCFMLVMGLATGFQPFAGYNYGAEAWHRLKEGFKTVMLYSSVLVVFFTVIFIIFGENLISLFINDPATIEAGTRILHAFCWGIPFIGIQVTMMITFQATGMAVKAMIVSLGRQCILYLPFLFILNNLFGFDGFIYAQPAADILTTLVAVFMSISFIKELNEKDKSKPSGTLLTV